MGLRRTGSVSVCCAALLLSGIAAAPAQAGIFYDIGIKTVYEDNVVGLLSDKSPAAAPGATPGPGTTMMGAMGSGPGSGPGAGGTGGAGSSNETFFTGTSSGTSGDMSVDVSAELGASVGFGKDTDLFLSGAVERLAYDTFRELNLTASGLSAGAVWQPGRSVTARIAANGLVKRFKDPARDSSAYGGSLVLKERISSALWVKESFTRERNRAEASFFSYDGNALAFWTGYAVAARTSLLAGYSYLVREYDEPAGFKEKANTFSLGLEWEFLDKWYLDLQYDRRASDSTLPGTDTTGNIYTLGARYSY